MKEQRPSICWIKIWFCKSNQQSAMLFRSYPQLLTPQGWPSVLCLRTVSHRVVFS